MSGSMNLNIFWITSGRAENSDAAGGSRMNTKRERRVERSAAVDGIRGPNPRMARKRKRGNERETAKGKINNGAWMVRSTERNSLIYAHIHIRRTYTSRGSCLWSTEEEEEIKSWEAQRRRDEEWRGQEVNGEFNRLKTPETQALLMNDSVLQVL